MGSCRNRMLWLGLGAVGVVLAVTTSSLGALVPLLLVVACPLSMVVMAAGMAGMARGGRRHDNGRHEDDELVELRSEVASLRERVDR